MDGFNGSGGILGMANNLTSTPGAKHDIAPWDWLGSTASAFGSGIGAGIIFRPGPGAGGHRTGPVPGRHHGRGHHHAMGAGNIAAGGTAAAAGGHWAARPWPPDRRLWALGANPPPARQPSPLAGGASLLARPVKPADLKAAFDGIDAKT